MSMHDAELTTLARSRPLDVAILLFPEVEVLDFAGPFEVFSVASRIHRAFPHRPFRVSTVAAQRMPVPARHGLPVVANYSFEEMTRADVLIVPGGIVDQPLGDPATLAWLEAATKAAALTASVCTGAFLLAEAGLLNGRRATAHWRFGRELAARYPRVRVEHEPLWVKDGNIYTSAGFSAGIDLALAWVEEDCGAALAHEAARELVLFLRRPGGQPQVSVSLASQASEMATIRELQVWIAEHLDQRLSVDDLASRMAMSVRNFERVFTREVGTTPSQYVMQARVEAARRLLERTDGGLKHVAAASGFGSIDVMRRAFVRLLGTTPRRYRELAAAPALSERSESNGASSESERFASSPKLSRATRSAR